MLKKLILILFFILLFLNTNSQNDYKDLDYFEYGCTFLDSLKYQEAIYYFDKAINLNPANSVYYYKRGNTYFILKDYNRAKDDFLYCLHMVPDESVYYHLAGICYEKMAQNNEALEYFTKGIEIEPVNLDCYKSRGNLYLKIDSFKLAIADYNYVLNNNSRDDFAYLNRGIANYNLKNIRSACSDWDNAKLLSNKSADKYIEAYCKKAFPKKEQINSNDKIEMPVFNNGINKDFRSFICVQLRYPANAIINCVQGTVILRFTVRSNGDLDLIKVINHVDPELDIEGIRIIKQSRGFWKGGTINGKPADIELTFPVTFNITPDCSPGNQYYINKGLRLFEKGEYENAIFCFSEVIKRDPYNKEIINKRFQSKNLIGDTLGTKEDNILLEDNTFKSLYYTPADEENITLLNVKIFYDSLWNICSQNKAEYFRMTNWNSNINFFDGEFKDYLLNGSLICSGEYTNKEKNGELKYFYGNGNQLLKGKFDHNKASENWFFYFENGIIAQSILITEDNILIEAVNDSSGINLNLAGTCKSTIKIPNYNGSYNLLNVSYKDGEKNDRWTFIVDKDIVLAENYKKGVFKSGEYYSGTVKISTTESLMKSWIIIPSHILRTEQLNFSDETDIENYPFIKR